MIGLLVIVVISWCLLHFIEKKNINVLGIIPNQKRIQEFFIALLFITSIHSLSCYIEGVLLNINWQLNHKINYINIFNAFIYHFKSALTEDLIFRGAILYILIQRIGSNKAILISAICFGIYHLFSFSIKLDRIIPILYIFIVTGFAGYVWAYTFYKTKSIYMAFGFHLGVNLINTCIYKSQPYGELIFSEISRSDISIWNNFIVVIFKGLFTSIVTLIFLKLYLKNQAQKINTTRDDKIL